jgi:hypothetical protein
MNNTKSDIKPFFKLSLLFLLLTYGSVSSGDASSCDMIASDPKSSVEDVMTACQGGFKSLDGCRITLEKACVNGVEVSPPELRRLKNQLGTGLLFTGVEGQGLSGKDFSQAQKKELNEKMYGTYETPGGKPYQLCSKVPDRALKGGGQLDLSQLPDGFVIESVPAIINPNENVASATFHWKLRMINGKPQYSVEIRRLFDLDYDFGIGTGSSFLEVISDLSARKEVRCTISGREKINSLTNDRKKHLAQLYVNIMSKLSNSGLNTAQLAENMHRMLGLSGSSDDAIATFQRVEAKKAELYKEEPATPAPGESHAKHPSHRRH